MNHLSQQMIGMDLRRPHIQRYRRRLQRELLRAGIGSEDRARMAEALETVGEPKVYSLDEAPAPGSRDPGPMPQVDIQIDLDEATHDSLSAIPHSQLYLYVRQQGLEVKPGDTKATIVSMILAEPQGEDS